MAIFIGPSIFFSFSAQKTPNTVVNFPSSSWNFSKRRILSGNLMSHNFEFLKIFCRMHRLQVIGFFVIFGKKHKSIQFDLSFFFKTCCSTALKDDFLGVGQ